jgi:hypothetical protein
MPTRPIIGALLSLVFFGGCAQSGDDQYAGWDTYYGPDNRFSVRYLAPPWTECTGTEYEDECSECPRQLLGSALCGGATNNVVLWIPPALLDPSFLLIPPYKLEISWTSGSTAVMQLAEAEGSAMQGAGLELLFEPRQVTLADGVTIGAEVGYRGPVHIIVDETPVNRPDEREYRVLYVSEGGVMYRVALDTAIDIDVPEARDLLASFTLDPEVAP